MIIMLMNILMAGVYFGALLGLFAYGYKQSVKKLIKQMEGIEK